MYYFLSFACIVTFDSCVSMTSGWKLCWRARVCSCVCVRVWMRERVCFFLFFRLNAWRNVLDVLPVMLKRSPRHFGEGDSDVVSVFWYIKRCSLNFLAFVLSPGTVVWGFWHHLMTSLLYSHTHTHTHTHTHNHSHTHARAYMRADKHSHRVNCLRCPIQSHHPDSRRGKTEMMRHATQQKGTEVETKSRREGKIDVFSFIFILFFFFSYFHRFTVRFTSSRRFICLICFFNWKVVELTWPFTYQSLSPPPPPLPPAPAPAPPPSVMPAHRLRWAALCFCWVYRVGGFYMEKRTCVLEICKTRREAKGKAECTVRYFFFSSFY